LNPDPIRIRIRIYNTAEYAARMKNTQKEIFFPNNIWVPQVDTDLKLLEIVDGLSDGPVYLLYLGEGGAGAVKHCNLLIPRPP
jgi:hypothetical protein